MNKQKKQLIELLNSTTPPHLSFPGLKLKEEDFVTLEDLIKLERSECYAKTIALRDISNGILHQQKYVKHIFYEEDKGPKLRLLFNEHIADDFRISEIFKLSDNEQFFCYTITPEVLEYLLSNNKNLPSQLDRLLIQYFKDELIYFKEQIEAGVFYADYQVYDIFKNFIIGVTHNGYIAKDIQDTISTKMDGFGGIIAHYLHNYYEFNLLYKNTTEESVIETEFYDIPNQSALPKKLYIHKPMLPQVIQDKINRG